MQENTFRFIFLGLNYSLRAIVKLRGHQGAWNEENESSVGLTHLFIYSAFIGN